MMSGANAQRSVGASASNEAALSLAVFAPCSPSGHHEPRPEFTACCEWLLQGEDLERLSGGSWPAAAQRGSPFRASRAWWRHT